MHMDAPVDKTGSGTEEMKMVEAAQGLVSQNLDKVEAQIDSTVDNAKNFVHELRSETEEAVDRTLSRFTGFWEGCRKSSRLRWSSDPGLSLEVS